VYLTAGSIRAEEGCCDSPQRHKRTNADYSYGFKQIPSTSTRSLYMYSSVTCHSEGKSTSTNMHHERNYP